MRACVTSQPASTFRFEQDMIQPVVEVLRGIATGPDWCVFTECTGPTGVADIVLARINPDVVARRVQQPVPPILDPIMAETLFVVSRYGPQDISSLAKRIGCSPGHLRKRGIRPLRQRGLLALKDGRLSACTEFPQAFDLIVAVEVKRSHWQRGLYQARRYLRFADKVFLALDSAYRHRVDTYTKDILAQRIGLVFADAAGTNAAVATDPGWNEPLSELDRAVMNERLLVAALPKLLGAQEHITATAVSVPMLQGVAEGSLRPV